MDDALAPGGHAAPATASGRGRADALFPDVVAPARRRRRPQRATVLTAAAVVVVTALGIGGLVIAREAAYASRVPGPTVPQVVTAFTSAVLGDGTAWSDTATPELVAAFGDAAPFTGGATIDVALTPDADVAYSDRGIRTDDATLADEATTRITAAYDLADAGEVTVTVAVDLERELTRDADDALLAASPWRISALTSTDAESTLTPATVCATSIEAITDLATSARVYGDLAVPCTGTDDPLSWLPSGADEQRWTADFPVYGQFDPPVNLLGFTHGIALTRVVIDTTPLFLVSIQTRASDGSDGWVLVTTRGVEG